MIIRKRPINKMVPADINMDDEAATPPSLPKTSSNSSALFKPRSVYTAKPSASVPPQEDKLESVTQKNNSPVSPSQPVMKNKSILDYLVLTNSKDASVQVGQSSAPSEQLKKVAKVTPITISPPASKPVARVSPHPQNVSPPHQPTLVNTTEDIKAKGNSPRNVIKDNWKAMSPPVEPRRSVPQESTPIPVPPINSTTTVMSPTSSSITNVLPTMATSPTPVVASPTAMRSPKIEHSPVITHSPVPVHSPSPVVSPQVPTFSPQLPMASSMPFNKERTSVVSSTAVSGTPGTPATDSELFKSEKKKRKKKKHHHSQTEESSQDDNASEQKVKKKKLKKLRKEQRDSSEEQKKKKKAKFSSFSTEGVWVEREISPIPKATTAPAKILTPPPQRAPPTNVVSPTVHSIPVIINSKISEPVKEHVQNIPCSKEPKSPKHKTHSKVVKNKKVSLADEVENKLRPFLLSYYSSSESTCSSPTMEEPEPVDNKILTPSIDDVFSKEQAVTPGNVVSTQALVWCTIYCLSVCK